MSIMERIEDAVVASFRATYDDILEARMVSGQSERKIGGLEVYQQDQLQQDVVVRFRMYRLLL